MTTLDLRSALERIAAKVTEVIEDAESQHPGGWGPDVTTVAVLREARDDLLNHRAALAQPEPLTPEEEAARYEVEVRWSTRYRHTAVALRQAVGSVRSLKLPDWLGSKIESAWEDSAYLVDITAPTPATPAQPEHSPTCNRSSGGRRCTCGVGTPPAPRRLSEPSQPEPGPTADEWTTLREAFAIGAVSYDGDSWFAADAGYGYDEAEATMNAARAILARLSETPR